MLSVWMPVRSLFTLLHLLLFCQWHFTLSWKLKTQNSQERTQKWEREKTSTKVWEKRTARSLPLLAVFSVRHFIKHKFNLYSNFNFFPIFFHSSKVHSVKTRSSYSVFPALFSRSIFLLLFFFCPRYFSIYFASTTASRAFFSFTCVFVVFAVVVGPGHVKK